MSEYLTSHRAIREALQSGERAEELVIAADSPRGRELTDLARRAGVAVRTMSRRELRQVAAGANDCALRIGEATAVTRRALEDVLGRADAESALLLVVDHVTDPHNYGAILRSADQFGVDAVIVPGRRAAPLSAVAMQSSAGTAEHVTIVTVPNLVQAIGQMQDAGFWVYAAEMSGEASHRTNLKGRTALVLGSEGKGVSRLVAERADALVRIPMGGHADSLNVSVACGVLLYEIRRQQGWLDER